jgi:hypothetical protein
MKNLHPSSSTRPRTPLVLAITLAVVSSFVLLLMFGVLAFTALLSANGVQSGAQFTPAIVVFVVLALLALVAHNVLVFAVSRRMGSGPTLGLTLLSLCVAIGAVCMLTVLAGVLTT